MKPATFIATSSTHGAYRSKSMPDSDKIYLVIGLIMFRMEVHKGKIRGRLLARSNESYLVLESEPVVVEAEEAEEEGVLGQVQAQVQA